MSYKTWHEYGYGIVVDDVRESADQNFTVEKLLNFIHCAPKLEERYLKWLHANYDSEVTDELYEDIGVNELLEYEGDCCYCGLAPIMREVILENEGIDLYVCDDFDGVQYLLYLPSYPWFIKDAEKNLAEEDITEIFRKYVSMLTDKPVNIDYLECQNGG